MNRTITVLLIALLLLGVVLAVGLTTDFSLFVPTGDAVSPRSILYLGTLPVEVEIADTEEERVAGLSGRVGLPSGRGMLFVFPEAKRYGIWMQGMNFPLDVVWIGENEKVVWIEEHISPDTYPKVFTSEVPARYVVEVNAGTVESFGIKEGTHVVLPRLSR